MHFCFVLFSIFLLLFRCLLSQNGINKAKLYGYHTGENIMYALALLLIHLMFIICVVDLVSTFCSQFLLFLSANQQVVKVVIDISFV